MNQINLVRMKMNEKLDTLAEKLEMAKADLEEAFEQEENGGGNEKKIDRLIKEICSIEVQISTINEVLEDIETVHTGRR